MPLVTATYSPPRLFRNGHFTTIYCSVFRKVHCEQQRERLTLPDGDFLDVDWSYANQPTDKVIVILHGLEGSAQRPYVKGTAKIFNENGFDACAVNFRSCSGETNTTYGSYHSGQTEDLANVIAHILQKSLYKAMVLKGFSLGANVVLKYLSTKTAIPKEVKAAVAVSAPCDLYGTMLRLHQKENVIYHTKFKKDLLGKLKAKQQRFPELLSVAALKGIKTLKDVDEVYTSKAHNFKNAMDYYRRASSLPNLSQIAIPTLVLNAKNDSFLSSSCYPYVVAKTNTNLYLETPEYGGHVGFYLPGDYSYNEIRSVDFMKNVIF